MKTARRTHPALWERIVAEVTAGDKGGRPGQWSARKAQLAVALYRQQGGGYIGPKSADNALAKWTREKWRTRSGRPSLVTGERYLPSKALAALSPQEYAATTRAKRAGMARGQQFVPQPERIAMKTAPYRTARPNGRHIVAYLTMWNDYWYSCDETQWKRLMAHVRRTGGEFGLDDPAFATSLKNPPKGAYKDERGRWGMASFVPHENATDFSLEDWKELDARVQRYLQRSKGKQNPARRNGFSMDDFNLFPTEAAAPRAPDYRAQGREALEARSGVQASVFDVYSVLKEPEPEIDPAGYYTAPYMKGIREVAWAVAAPRASTAAQATAIGKRLIQKMIPRTKLASHLPLLVGCPLYVAYPGGVVRIEPAAKRNPAPQIRSNPPRSSRLYRVYYEDIKLSPDGEPFAVVKESLIRAARVEADHWLTVLRFARKATQKMIEEHGTIYIDD